MFAEPPVSSSLSRIFTVTGNLGRKSKTAWTSALFSSRAFSRFHHQWSPFWVDHLRYLSNHNNLPFSLSWRAFTSPPGAYSGVTNLVASFLSAPLIKGYGFLCKSDPRVAIKAAGRAAHVVPADIDTFGAAAQFTLAGGLFQAAGFLAGM
jgi:hypothetical protein